MVLMVVTNGAAASVMDTERFCCEGNFYINGGRVMVVIATVAVEGVMEADCCNGDFCSVGGNIMVVMVKIAVVTLSMEAACSFFPNGNGSNVEAN